MNTDNAKFFDLFKRIEGKLGDSRMDHFMVKYNEATNKDTRLKHYKNQMKTLVKLRNIEAHHYKTNHFYDVSQNSIEILKKILDCIEKPRRAYDISIKSSDMMICDIDDRLIDIVTFMGEKSYSYIPILKDKRFYGVFSSDVLFNYFFQTTESILDDTVTLESLKDYLPIEAHFSEKFKFVKRGTLLADVEKMLFKSYEKPKRLEAVFITENGKNDEELLGMVTAWDILNLYSRD